MRLAIVIILLAAAACSRGTATSLTGRESPREAVTAFLNAVKAEDLQAMSEVWGNDKGPARDRIPRDQLEKRELLMQCYLKHDTFRILGDLPGDNGRRVISVRITRGRVSRELNFDAVKGPSNRWYMENADLSKVQDLCTSIPR